MAQYQMGKMEKRFADLIWENEPIRSGDLAELSRSKLGWKKSTMYTVLHRLCDKGIFQNVKGEVSSLITKDNIFFVQGEQCIKESFGGSVPAFFAAFLKGKRLSQEDAAELHKLVDEYSSDR